jgi:hypothetical protein
MAKQNLHVLFIFGPHRGIKNADKSITFLEKFKPNIYAPEFSALDGVSRQQVERHLLDYVEKAHSPDSRMKEYFKRQIAWAQKRGIPIKILEDRLNNEDIDNTLKFGAKNYPVLKTFYDIDNNNMRREEKLNIFTQVGYWLPGFDKLASFMSSIREQKIIHNLLSGQFVEELAENGYDFKGLKKLKVALTMGAGHEPMYDNFIKQNSAYFKKIDASKIIFNSE